MKVALAWDSAVHARRATTPTASTLTVDLDLLVRDSRGVQVASAASWDNSYEVVEFAASAGRDLRDRHPPVVGHRQRLVRRGVDGDRLLARGHGVPVRSTRRRPIGKAVTRVPGDVVDHSCAVFSAGLRFDDFSLVEFRWTHHSLAGSTRHSLSSGRPWERSR